MSSALTSVEQSNFLVYGQHVNLDHHSEIIVLSTKWFTNNFIYVKE
jgi:hypothetical protein